MTAVFTAEREYRVARGVAETNQPCRRCGERRRHAIRLSGAVPIDELVAITSAFQKAQDDRHALSHMDTGGIIVTGQTICRHRQAHPRPARKAVEEETKA